MIQLDKLYMQRSQFNNYHEQLFIKPAFDTGLMKPFLFLVNKRNTLTASHFTISSIEDIGYDIHMITSDQQVLLYLIDVKHPVCKAVLNGLIISNRQNIPISEVEDDIHIRYNMDNFLVLTNKVQSCTVFGRNMTMEPKT